MSAASAGTPDAGGGTATGLGNTTAAIIINRTKCEDNLPRRMAVYVAATGAFDLNYLFTPDKGTNWFIGKQVAASTVTVDGGTASYVKSALLDIPIGYEYKVEIYNNSGGSIDYAYEVRQYNM